MDIVERLKKCEENALEEIMELYGNNLLRTAILLVKDAHVAEEVVQDTFVIAFRKAGQLKDPSKLKNWLIMITMNECRNRMRRWSWKNIFLNKEADQDHLLVDETRLQPEDSLLTGWRSQVIQHAIGELPYKYREVVTLFYFQEMTVKEIAELIGENESNIKTRLSRGRGLLKESLVKGDVDIAK